LLTLANSKIKFGLRLKEHVGCIATNLAKIARRKKYFISYNYKHSMIVSTITDKDLGYIK